MSLDLRQRIAKTWQTYLDGEQERLKRLAKLNAPAAMMASQRKTIRQAEEAVRFWSSDDAL